MKVQIRVFFSNFLIEYEMWNVEENNAVFYLLNQEDVLMEDLLHSIVRCVDLYVLHNYIYLQEAYVALKRRGALT